MQEIKEMLKYYDEMLPVGKSLSFSEYESRSSLFLEAMSKVIDLRHMFGEEKIKLLTLQTVTYAHELSKGTAKTMTENKVTAEASAPYCEAREALESIDNDLSYLKAKYETYTNGHIFYRNLCKSE